MQRLLPYLPDGSADAAEALLLLAGDLDGILTADGPEFWAVVRSDASIVGFLDSYLRNALRPFDDGFRDQSDIEHALWRHAAILFTRLLSSRGGGIPAHADRSALLARLLTVPSLMDACALFGAAFKDPAPLAAAVASMLSLAPALGAELPSVGAEVAVNLQQVAEMTVDACIAAKHDPQAAQGVADGVAYVLDASLTMCALLRTHPAAAEVFMRDGGALVEALGAVHDGMLPSAEAVAATTHGEAGDALARRCLQAEVASEAAVALLLHHAYLNAAALGAAGGSSSFSCRAPAKLNAAAVQRGEALLHALTLLGHREGGSGVPGRGGGLSLGPALAHRHGLGGAIQAAVAEGFVALDEAQEDYLAALMDVPSLAAAPTVVPGEIGLDSAANDTAGPSTSSAAAGGVSLVPKSLVAQVRDLLPDYGEGYIAACLEALGRSPERVINALLEGPVPTEVAALDSALSYDAYAAVAQRKAAQSTVLDPGPSSSSSRQQQQATRDLRSGGGGGGPRLDSLTAKYLDAKEASYAAKIKTIAVESQWEYEDEYDDSFDELMHLGADGVAEGEGEGEEGKESGTSVAAAAALSSAMAVLSVDGGGEGSGARAAALGGGGGRGRGGKPRGKGGRFWVLDGRIYHYAKPGAKEVASEADAEAAIKAAQVEALQIHGLGPGGNKPLRATAGPYAPQQQGAAPGEEGGAGPSGEPSGGGGRSGGRGRGGGRSGGGGGGRGGDSHKWKDKHKAAIGNHHRKDRAAAKQSRGM